MTSLGHCRNGRLSRNISHSVSGIIHTSFFVKALSVHSIHYFRCSMSSAITFTASYYTAQWHDNANTGYIAFKHLQIQRHHHIRRLRRDQAKLPLLRRQPTHGSAHVTPLHLAEADIAVTTTTRGVGHALTDLHVRREPARTMKSERALERGVEYEVERRVRGVRRKGEDVVDGRIRERYAHGAVRTGCGDVEEPACAGAGRCEEADVGADRAGGNVGVSECWIGRDIGKAYPFVVCIRALVASPE